MNWSEIPSLSALRAFEAAARLESLTKAAAELNVTHAAIAQHVRALEKEFGTALLERRGRGVVPTEQGRHFFSSLSVGFRDIASAVAALREAHLTRPLNVSVTPSFATNWLMPRIGDFWSLHPDIVVNVNPSSAVIDLKRDKFDMAIRFGGGDWPDLVTHKLTDGDYWAVARPDILASRSAACLQDVADLPWLLEHHMRERQQLIEAEGVNLADVSVRMFDLNALVTSAVLAGLGVAIQPMSLVASEVKAGRLQKICELRQAHLAYYIVHLPVSISGNAVKFRDWLLQGAKLDIPAA